MGLPGAGKTTFAHHLRQQLAGAGHSVEWFNADQLRSLHNDWDFSQEGRLRQSQRMADRAQASSAQWVIADFVAPLAQQREIYQADWTVWIDTIEQGRFEDTNRVFDPPATYDFRITQQNAPVWASYVVDHLVSARRRPTFDPARPTVQMMGRYQPWHAGHRALFEQLLHRTGQVCVMVRDCQGWNNSNPFDADQVHQMIRRDLDPLYQGMYTVITVPNIVHIGYGRDVGYTIQQEMLDPEITAISATQIRQQMGLQ
jgi:adenylylsulfate kinase